MVKLLVLTLYQMNSVGLKQELLKIYNNNCHTTTPTPREWNLDISIQIYKGQPLVRENLVNYRGLFLSSNVSKLYERIIQDDLQTFVEKNAILEEVQGAYRKGRNYPIGNGKRNSTIVTIDLSKAFDLVDRSMLMDYLRGRK